MTITEITTCQYHGCDANVIQSYACDDGNANIQSRYCSMHVCPVAECTSPIITNPGAEACLHHTCSYFGCVSCARNASNACNQHICIIKGCTSVVQFNRLFCVQHSCSFENCPGMVHDEFHKLCHRHMCSVDKCPYPVLSGRFYCERHACSYHKLYNQTQVCQREAYPYENITFGSFCRTLCMYHCCTNEKCKYARLPDRDLCAQCLNVLGKTTILEFIDREKVSRGGRTKQSVTSRSVKSKTSSNPKQVITKPSVRVCPYPLRSRRNNLVA